MNFQNGRKILTLLTFGCRSDNPQTHREAFVGENHCPNKNYIAFVELSR